MKYADVEDDDDEEDADEYYNTYVKRAIRGFRKNA